MEKKFTALRIFAVVTKVLAWIVAGLTVLGFFGVIVLSATSGAIFNQMMKGMTPSSYGNFNSMGAFGIIFGVVYAFFILIYGAFMFISLLAWSDLMTIALQVEENTRAMRPAATPTA